MLTPHALGGISPLLIKYQKTGIFSHAGGIFFVFWEILGKISFVEPAAWGFLGIFGRY
jgi:hypothetical protein